MLPSLRVSNAATLIVLAAFGVALGVWFFTDENPAAQAFVANAEMQKTGLGASPFGAGEANLAIDTHRAIAPAIELLGIGHARNGQAFASMSIYGAATRQYVVGDVVSLGVRLTRIVSGSVELQRGEMMELLPVSASVSKRDAFPDSPGAMPGIAGNDAVASSMPLATVEPNIITHRVEQPAPSSNSVDRAIQRATRL